jgi:chromosome segregation ATPase
VEALVMAKLDLEATISMGEMSKKAALQRAKDMEQELGEYEAALSRTKGKLRETTTAYNVLSTNKRDLELDCGKLEARITTLES